MWHNHSMFTASDDEWYEAEAPSRTRIPHMRRVKELQRAMNIQQGPTPKTFTITKISCSLVPPASRIAALKMLNRASQISKQGQTVAETSQESKGPICKANLSSTSRKKVDRTMTRATITNHLQKTISPTNLTQATRGQIPHESTSGT